MTRTRLGSGLLLAAGILASTGLAAVTQDSGWLILSGPALMAVCAAGAGIIQSRRPDGVARGTLPVSLLLGVAILLAGGLTALGDPKQVANLMPVLGSAVATPIVIGQRRCRLPFLRRS